MTRNGLFRAGALATEFFFLLIFAAEPYGYARVGGGRSSGSRGSRPSYSSSRSYSSPSNYGSSYNTRQPYNAYNQSQSRPRGTFLRGMAGGIAGGILGSMLFRSLGFGHGMGGGFGGGGIGLLDIILIGLIVYLVYRYIKKRRAAAPVRQVPAFRDDAAPSFGGPSAADPSDGIGRIRWSDSGFSEQGFKDSCMDNFFRIQGAWANRDMTSVRSMLTDEMYGIIQADAARLQAEGRFNKLDNIAVRSVDIEEAWQENGNDYITVKFLANLLDYTVDEKTGAVVSGSKTDPVKFEEFWTFTRSTGRGAWQLSAIDQA